MNVYFSDDGWGGYLYRAGADVDIHRRVNALIEDVRRTTATGLGMSEALKGDLSGWWSRRITNEHRMVYRAQGRRGEDQRIEVIQCRHHS